MWNGKKRALVTGITGQTGSYLAEILLEQGYQVHGMRRRTSSFSTGRIDHLISDRGDVREHDLHLHYGDMTDASDITRVISEVKPDEIYNLAAQSHVGVSFLEPIYTADATGNGALRILECIRQQGMINDVRFYQASSSELFGKVRETPQTELTPFYPRSPYGCAKLFGYWAAINYRESYGMFASNGVLYNHESPRRGETFVTRKITRALARIRHGLQECLHLGNLEARRDWGHAQDCARAIWMILQHHEPDDFIIATGEQHSVREFVELAGQMLDFRIVWTGNGLDEVGWDANSGHVIVRVDPAYLRPSEVETLLGDSTKARKVLGWKPMITFEELVLEMVENDNDEVLSTMRAGRPHG